MSEMVERVARALWKQHNGLALRVDEGVPDWAKEEARTAIAAMREPTEGMNEAGSRIVSLILADVNGERCEDSDAVWRAMIDEALK